MKTVPGTSIRGTDCPRPGSQSAALTEEQEHYFMVQSVRSLVLRLFQRDDVSRTRFANNLFDRHALGEVAGLVHV